MALGLAWGMMPITLERIETGIVLRVEPWGLEAKDGDAGSLGAGLRKALDLFGGSAPGMRVEIRAELPPGAGLGSSAALAVCLVRCLAWVRETRVNNEVVRKMAHELERIFHGTPSGLDDTVSTYGGLCLFRRDGLRREIGKRLTGNAIELPFAVPTLVVGNTGVKRSTAAMVAGVRKQHEEDRENVESIFDDMDLCLDDGLRALQAEDASSLGMAMQSCHGLLAGLGLSCPEADTMVELAKAHGASGAKMTGAGGGGAVLALGPGREKQIQACWRAAGFEAMIVGPASSWGNS